MNCLVQKKDNVMKCFVSAIVLVAAFAAPAGAFTVDLTLPTLTFPTPDETTQGCIAPAQIGTAACSATE